MIHLDKALWCGYDFVAIRLLKRETCWISMFISFPTLFHWQKASSITESIRYNPRPKIQMYYSKCMLAYACICWFCIVGQNSPIHSAHSVLHYRPRLVCTDINRRVVAFLEPGFISWYLTFSWSGKTSIGDEQRQGHCGSPLGRRLRHGRNEASHVDSVVVPPPLTKHASKHEPGTKFSLV